MAPSPAPTVPLKTGPAANEGGAPTVPLATASAGDATKPLPKATVQLQNTQQLGAPTGTGVMTQGATVHTADADDEEPSDALPNILSILAFVIALAVLALGIMTWTQSGAPVGDLFQ